MKNILFAFCLLTFCVGSSQASEVPKFINLSKRGAGPGGYDKISQRWTGDNSGLLRCADPGTKPCLWSVVDGAGYPIDLELETSHILAAYEQGTNTGLGTIVQGEIVIHYWVLESLGDGDGTVRFYFESGL